MGGALASDVLTPDWPAPANIGSIVSTRLHGISHGAYAENNLATHVGDDPAVVVQNRHRFQLTASVAKPCWLNQVHGTKVIDLQNWQDGIDADASWTDQSGQACVILTADCLPILLCNKTGTEVAAVHAGWRGLAAGILKTAVAKFRSPSAELLAYIGPHIGAKHFEVGQDVRDAMALLPLSSASVDAAFQPDSEGKYLADLGLLAKMVLEQLGVYGVYGGDLCSVSRNDLFYSFRKEGVTGRNASAIWIKESLNG